MEASPEEFKKIGALVFSISRVDIYLTTILSSFFSDWSAANLEKDVILNGAFFDESIFPSFENKRRLFIKAIKDIARLAKEKNMPFDEDSGLALCNELAKLQEIRNKLAHKIISFPGTGKITFSERKSSGERLMDQRTGIKGTIKRVEIDVEAAIDSASEIIAKFEWYGRKFLQEARNIQSR